MPFIHPCIFLYLTGPNAHGTLGFANGFIYNMSNDATTQNYMGKNNVIHDTLNSVLNSILYGMCFGWISNYIGESTPQCIKIYLPITLVGVSGIHICRTVRKIYNMNFRS